MEYWIDGYNLILRAGWERSMTLERAREHLVRRLVPLKVPVRIYFDARGRGAGGPELETPSTRIDVRFVSEGTADDRMIADLLRDGAKGVTLVTDDRELRGRAKQHGANTLGSEKMVHRLEKRGGGPGGEKPSRRKEATPGERKLKSSEVDDWMQWFGYDNEDPEDLLRGP